MSLCLVDTSVLCEMIAVPGKSSSPDQFRRAVGEKVRRGEELLLPFVAVLETGNHIGQAADGQQRRAASLRFVREVRLALKGESPFHPTPELGRAALDECLGDFVEYATRGVGFGDVTISREYERQCLLWPSRRVYVWSLDEHLAGLDRAP